ncbi:MAG: class I SAM-dependent methyltransferase family protein [Nitrososphaerales archaeon]
MSNPERVSTGVDVVGDIAIVRLPELSAAEKRRLARALTKEVKNVKCVYEQEGGIEGEFRLRKLKHIAGEKRTLTLHRENGCVFRVDVARCYFSPRLSTERLAIAGKVASRERVLNMFAGVGPFSITVAKKAGARVTSCEINKYACDLHEENDRLNKVQDKVRVIRGDAAELPAREKKCFDRVLMPHPSQADMFLPVALAMAKKRATIHYYRHVLGRSEDEASARMVEELSGLIPTGTRIATRRVREVGPRWLEMAADLRLPA